MDGWMEEARMKADGRGHGRHDIKLSVRITFLVPQNGFNLIKTGIQLSTALDGEGREIG